MKHNVILGYSLVHLKLMLVNQASTVEELCTSVQWRDREIVMLFHLILMAQPLLAMVRSMIRRVVSGLDHWSPAQEMTELFW